MMKTLMTFFMMIFFSMAAMAAYRVEVNMSYGRRTPYSYTQKNGAVLFFGTERRENVVGIGSVYRYRESVPVPRIFRDRNGNVSDVSTSRMSQGEYRRQTQGTRYRPYSNTITVGRNSPERILAYSRNLLSLTNAKTLVGHIRRIKSTGIAAYDWDRAHNLLRSKSCRDLSLSDRRFLKKALKKKDSFLMIRGMLSRDYRAMIKENRNTGITRWEMKLYGSSTQQQISSFYLNASAGANTNVTRRLRRSMVCEHGNFHNLKELVKSGRNIARGLNDALAHAERVVKTKFEVIAQREEDSCVNCDRTVNNVGRNRVPYQYTDYRSRQSTQRSSYE